MTKKFESLLEYKKSTKDWHYDPMVKSNDCEFVGTIKNFNFEKIKHELGDKDPESSVKLYEDDFKNGKSIPDQLSPNSIGASKLDHLRHGYTDHNAKYSQWIESRDKIPADLQKIKEITGLENATVAVMKQDPGNTNPWHYDTYEAAIKRAGLTENNPDAIRRYLIFLEDWHWGHFMQVGNNVLYQWKAGDTYTWRSGMYHLASNSGIKPKYTCQVTGKVTKKSLHLNVKKDHFI